MELTKNTSSHSQQSYKLKKKHGEVTYLNWKENTKENTEETLCNLSSDNVYLLLVSFRRFHEIFDLD